jgi:hypothetical protein
VSFLITVLLPWTAASQEPAKPTAPADSQQPAKTEPAKPDSGAKATPGAAAAQSPLPAAEPSFSGSIDLGYRWLTGVGGNFDAYRSIVNVGSGPKLIGADFTAVDPKHRVFDRIHVRAYNWGDEPYQTLHVNARKSGLYEANADYRDFAYFNFLPSYADPLLSRGIVLDEQSYDTRRRIGAFWLDIFPGRQIVPYFKYDRDDSSGTGVTAFVNGATNAFPVPTKFSDLNNAYAGGVRFEFRRWHATLEQGGITFTSDQNLYQPSGSPLNYGNQFAPIFGQTTYLSSLAAVYGIHGDTIYTKGLFTANTTSWMDFFGQFLYSQPDSSVHYNQAATGNLFFQPQVLFYNSEQYLLSATAKLPHTTANAGAEIRPRRHVRILESWLTDRLHNGGGASSTQVLTSAGSSQTLAAVLSTSLITNYNQQEINILVDAPWHLSFRGGYRYVWGDAYNVTLPPAGLAGLERGELRRNVGIGSVTYRPSQTFSVTGEIEGAASDGVYFRTSLYNYQKIRAQARYQLSGSLSASADFNFLNNQNPITGINYDFRSIQESLSLFWSPAGSKRFDFEGTYSRSALRAYFTYLEPQNLQPQRYLYRENANIVSGLVNVNFPAIGANLVPKLSAGGSFFMSSGSRPTSYYQPVAKLWVPLHKHASWFTEWRYYGYGEAFYLYEGFRAHVVTTGLRFTR